MILENVNPAALSQNSCFFSFFLFVKGPQVTGNLPLKDLCLSFLSSRPLLTKPHEEAANNHPSGTGDVPSSETVRLHERKRKRKLGGREEVSQSNNKGPCVLITANHRMLTPNQSKVHDFPSQVIAS